MGDTALDLDAIEARCEALDERVSKLYDDIPALVAEIGRLRTDLAAEHALMIMYSDRGAAVRRKLQEVGAIAHHEEIANLDAIARLGADCGHTYCAFCGAKYPQGTPRHGDGALTQHIMECPVHPMREVEQERDRALAELALARVELNRVRQDAQDQSDEVQELWLSPCEAEGLRRQLAHTQRQLAAASEAAEWLWGFYDGNTLIAKPGYEDEISEAWGKLLIAADSTPSALQLQERLTTLDAAEAALADCGIGGIFAEFDGLPDAINQMAQHIKKLTQEPVEIEMTDAEIAEVLRTELSKALDECTQTVHAERQLRLTAEVVARERNNRLAEAKRQYQAAKQRAEALTALVTKGVAELLEKLASHTRARARNYANPLSVYVHLWRKDARDADSLAARIREALGETNGAS